MHAHTTLIDSSLTANYQRTWLTEATALVIALYHHVRNQYQIHTHIRAVYVVHVLVYVYCAMMIVWLKHNAYACFVFCAICCPMLGCAFHMFEVLTQPACSV